MIEDDPYYESHEEQFSLRFIALEGVDNPDSLVLDPSRSNVNVTILDDDGTFLVFIYL